MTSLLGHKENSPPKTRSLLGFSITIRCVFQPPLILLDVLPVQKHPALVRPVLKAPCVAANGAPLKIMNKAVEPPAAEEQTFILLWQRSDRSNDALPGGIPSLCADWEVFTEYRNEGRFSGPLFPAVTIPVGGEETEDTTPLAVTKERRNWPLNPDSQEGKGQRYLNGDEFDHIAENDVAVSFTFKTTWRQRSLTLQLLRWSY